MLVKIDDLLLEYCECSLRGTGQPSLGGLAQWLGVSARTLFNIRRGEYAPGKPYSDSPCKTRRIANSAFGAIREASDRVSRRNRLTSKKGEMEVVD